MYPCIPFPDSPNACFPRQRFALADIWSSVVPMHAFFCGGASRRRISSHRQPKYVGLRAGLRTVKVEGWAEGWRLRAEG